jgi:transcriptional regulator with XRE-family HTH domain
MNKNDIEFYRNLYKRLNKLSSKNNINLINVFQQFISRRMIEERIKNGHKRSQIVLKNNKLSNSILDKIECNKMHYSFNTLLKYIMNLSNIYTFEYIFNDFIIYKNGEKIINEEFISSIEKQYIFYLDKFEEFVSLSSLDIKSWKPSKTKNTNVLLDISPYLIGDYIKILKRMRFNNRTSNANIAAICGLSPNQYSRLINGLVNVNHKKWIIPISKGFGISEHILYFNLYGDNIYENIILSKDEEITSDFHNDFPLFNQLVRLFDESTYDNKSKVVKLISTYLNTYFYI